MSEYFEIVSNPLTVSVTSYEFDCAVSGHRKRLYKKFKKRKGKNVCGQHGVKKDLQDLH